MSPNLPIDSMDRAPSHRKPPVPRASDIAARLAAGETLAVIAAECENSVSTLRRRINREGYSSTSGLPVAQDEKAPTIACRMPAWFADALCAQVGGDCWFPEAGESFVTARKLCGRCDVKGECLEYALENNEAFGIFGGLSPRQRKTLKRDRAS